MSNVARIICADWGKERKKRAAYEVLVADRVVRQVTADVREVGTLLAYAAKGNLPTLVTFDAPIGVPESFIASVRSDPENSAISGFMDWLFGASLEHCIDAGTWCVNAPFFQVPKGDGALGKFEAAARLKGAELRRKIETQTGGRSVFITAGIPGSVGSAARDIWRGIVATRRAGVSFRVWPFEGSEDVLHASSGPIVAEIYPRAAYATALVDSSPRPRMRVAKSDKRGAPKGADHVIRGLAIKTLLATRWSKVNGVTFEHLDRARENEDDFDAMMTAAALLRGLIEGLPLHASPLHVPSIEGAILGTGTVDFGLPETEFR